ncbi:MAG: hypothetical protein IPP83_19825 [Flavobacteriales bacterium]|nr:hypothetical protein [Flavobacteriales bacterium]
MRRYRVLLALFSIIDLHSAFAQQNDVPLQRDIYIDVERNAAKLDARIHSGLKPLIESRADLTNVMGYRVDSSKYYYVVTEKLFKEHLLIVNEGDFHLTVDPLFHQEYGRDEGNTSAYADTTLLSFNTRGFWVRGDIGPKVSFQTMFHENQGRVPQYLYQRVLRTEVLPGQGRVKIKNETQLDYGWSQGNVSYSPVKWLNIQLGHGKHFVGHGYRSVLLSDNAINSPYLEFSVLAPNRKWQYSTWHTKLMHGVTRDDRIASGESSENLFYWTRARFHHLSVDLGRAQVGLFEATLFRNLDQDRQQAFDAMELNPVIGLNTLRYGFGNGTKCLVGTDLRVKLTDKAYIYGQFATDGPGRYAWQAGARAFDVLRKDLHVQVEYNAASPFMYMNSPVRQAYMHGGYPLAHPLGTSFGEFVAIVDLGVKRFWFQGKVNLAAFERDTSTVFNNGTDLDRPDVDLPSPDGPVHRTLTYLDLNASYLVNPNTNLRIVAGMWRRDQPGSPDIVQSTYIYIAVRTNLFNRYYDL